MATVPPIDDINEEINGLNDSLKDLTKIIKSLSDEGKGLASVGKELYNWNKVTDELKEKNKELSDIYRKAGKDVRNQVSGAQELQQLLKEIKEGSIARLKLGEEENKLASLKARLASNIAGTTQTDVDAQQTKVDKLQDQLTAYKDILTGQSQSIKNLSDEQKEQLKQFILAKGRQEQLQIYKKNHEDIVRLIESITDENERNLAIDKYRAQLAKEEAQKQQDKFNEALKESSVYQKILSLKKGISSILGFEKISIATIVEKAFQLDQLYTNNAKQLAISKDLSEDITKSTVNRAIKEGSIASFGSNLVQTQKNILEAQTQLNTELGTANFFSKERLQDQVALVQGMGIEAGAAAKIQNLSMLSGATNKQILDSVNNRVIGLRNESKINLDNRKVLEDVAKVSGQLAVQYKNNPEELAKAVVQARALGLTLEQTAGMADKLLNFESSIESELKAELLTGKALNLEQARYYALIGDSAKAAKELMNQIGGIQEYENMNVIQRRAYAEALGMSADELANSLRTQEVLSKMGLESEEKLSQMRREAIAQGKEAQFLEEMRRRGTSEDMIVQQQQLGAQEKMNMLVDKMLEMFSNLAEPLTNMVNAFSDMLGKGNALKNLVMVIGGIMTTKMLLSALSTVTALVNANAQLVAQRAIQAQLSAIAGENAIRTGATAAFSMGPAWPIGIAAIGGILAALGISSALSGGSFSGGEASINSTPSTGTTGDLNRTTTPRPQSQPPIVVHSYLQVNGQTGQVWKDELNKSDSTGKVA